MGNKNKQTTATVKKEEQTFKILLLGSGESGKVILKIIKNSDNNSQTNKNNLW